MTKKEAIQAAKWVGGEFRAHNTYIAHDTKLHKYPQFADAAQRLGLEHARAAAIAGWQDKDREVKGGKK